MTDFNDLDQFLGRYVSLTDPDGESAAGFLIQIRDEVDYIPHPVRSVMLDWGQGWRVGKDTEVDVYPASPQGQKTVQVTSGIDILHEFAHEGGCPDMNCRVRARGQLRALRVWRMKQEDAYWQHRYVRQVRESREDPAAVAYIMEEAAQEGAPENIMDHLRIIAERAYKAAAEGS
jgi:hypothetical protein